MSANLIQQHLLNRLPALTLLWQEPTLRQLNELALTLHCPVRFTDFAPQSARAYEQHIHDTREVPTRPDHWHDRFNAAMWLIWPHSKLSLNRQHIIDLDVGGVDRSRRRDALTLLDEAGVVLLVSDSSLVKQHQQHAWEALFWRRRESWGRSICPLIIGHGLAEQMLKPYIGLTAKAVHVVAGGPTELDLTPRGLMEVDQQLARIVRDQLATPAALTPLPILGIPGWHPDNGDSDFFQNRDYFRPLRRRTK